VGAGASLTFAGAESNLAIGLSRLGHRVRWLSALGDDVFGRDILRMLRAEGVDVGEVQVSGGAPTGAMFKSERGWAEPEVLYYRKGSAFGQCTSSSFADTNWAGVQLFFVSGITPALSSNCRDLLLARIGDAKSAGVTVWLDPNFRSKLWSSAAFRECLLGLLPLVDVLLPGREEAEILTGETTPQEIGARLHQLGVPTVILKWGAGGAWFLQEGQENVFVAGQPLAHVVDAIGAGDAFAAGVVSGHLDGLEPGLALERGHALGAMACLRQGDWEGAPNRRELEQFLAKQTCSAR